MPSNTNFAEIDASAIRDLTVCPVLPCTRRLVCVGCLHGCPLSSCHSVVLSFPVYLKNLSRLESIKAKASLNSLVGWTRVESILRSSLSLSFSLLSNGNGEV